MKSNSSKLKVFAAVILLLSGATWFVSGIAKEYKVQCKVITASEFAAHDRFAVVSDLPIINSVCICDRLAPRRQIRVIGRLDVDKFRTWAFVRKPNSYVESQFEKNEEWDSSTRADQNSLELSSQFAEKNDPQVDWLLIANEWQYSLRINAGNGNFELVAVPTDTP